MSSSSTAEKSAVLFVRIDKDLSEALQNRCLELGKKKQGYVTELLQAALSAEPDPNLPKAWVPEVAPDDGGKAGGVPDTPSNSILTGDGGLRGVSPSLFPIPRHAESGEGFSLSGEEKGEAKQKVRKLCRQMPEGFERNPALLLYAEQNGVLNPQAEVDQFTDHHRARGTVFLDWHAAFRTWIRNAVRFQAKHLPNVVSANSRKTEKQRVAEQIFGVQAIEGVSRRIPG